MSTAPSSSSAPASIDTGGHRTVRRHHDAALDQGARLAVTDGPGIGPPAHQQAEPGDDHGLARTGLAGDDAQPGSELEDGVPDDAEPAQAHLE